MKFLQLRPWSEALVVYWCRWLDVQFAGIVPAALLALGLYTAKPLIPHQASSSRAYYAPSASHVTTKDSSYDNPAVTTTWSCRRRSRPKTSCTFRIVWSNLDQLELHGTSFPCSILVRMSLRYESREEIGRVGWGCYEDPREDATRKTVRGI